MEYDRHIREQVLMENEYMIQQLESENAHLRKLLTIPEDLFKEDPEEQKKKEAQKKKNMLKSIDDKLKAAEKKIAKKQTAQDIYMQQQREQGFDPFELDQEDYDLYRLSKLKDHQDMPKEVKEQLHTKIYGKVEERNYQQEMQRQHERGILQEFARVYGYDVNKHQPNPGEIEVEYLQAYVAECRAKEEADAKKDAFAKQKEALKASVAMKKPSAKEGEKPASQAAPVSKKEGLTLQTDMPEVYQTKSDKQLDTPQEEEEDFSRDEE